MKDDLDGVQLTIVLLLVLVFDTMRGVRIHSKEPPFTVEDDASCTLVTDARRSRFAVLYAQKDKYVFAFATVHADNAATAQPLLSGTRLSLAAGLASSLGNRSTPSISRTKAFSWKSSLVDPSRAFTTSSHLEQGVRLLEDALAKVRSGSKEISADSFLRRAFEHALKEALGRKASVATTNGRFEDNPQDAILSKNGGGINGIHCSSKKTNGDAAVENGHNHYPSGDLLVHSTSIPQPFVDSAVSLVVAVLHLSSSTKVDGTVRNDARLLLGRLVRSGKLSARTHLVPAADAKKSFSNLMRSLELTDMEERQDTQSAYTPFDLANDIFRHCSDVSEHQMVAVLHYMVSRALPKDVAFFFIRNQSFSGDHPILAKLTRFSALDSKRKLSASEKDEHTVLGRKLILSGSATLVKSIVEYSRCNESLLRDALATEFSEVGLRFLSRFLVELLSSPEKFSVTPEAGAIRNSIQWLSALCDCLQHASPSDEDVKLIQSAVATQLSAAGAIASLQGALSDALSGSTGRSDPGDHVVKGEKSPRNLPPYQIERIVF